MRNSSLHSREHCNALTQTIHLFSRTQYRLDEWHGNGTTGSPLLCPRHLSYRWLTRRGPNGGWGLHSQVWDGLALSGGEKQRIPDFSPSRNGGLLLAVSSVPVLANLLVSGLARREMQVRGDILGPGLRSAGAGAPWPVSSSSPLPAVANRRSTTLLSQRGCRGSSLCRPVSVGSAVAQVALVVSVGERVPPHQYRAPWCGHRHALSAPATS
jgi:hypothetical protein